MTVSTARPTTLADRERSGELEGFRPGHTPSTAAWPIGGDVVAEVMATTGCAACPQVGLGWRDFTSIEDPRSWRSYSVCPACGHSEEF